VRFKSLDFLKKKSIDLNRDWNQWFKSHWFKSANPGTSSRWCSEWQHIDLVCMVNADWPPATISHSQNKMTYNVSNGMLNLTHSPPCSTFYSTGGSA